MSDGTAFQLAKTFETIICYKCSIEFAVDSRLRARWRDSGESFYCPSGHSQHYTTSTVQKLEKQLQQQKDSNEYLERRIQSVKAEAKMAGYRERAQKAAKTRLKNRIAAGVCPCCTRSFENLQRHMKNQHPEFSSSEAQ